MWDVSCVNVLIFLIAVCKFLLKLNLNHLGELYNNLQENHSKTNMLGIKALTAQVAWMKVGIVKRGEKSKQAIKPLYLTSKA